MSLRTEEEAAQRINMSPSFLRQSRSKKAKTEGPPWVKLGAAVRYRDEDFDAWINRHLMGHRPDNEQESVEGGAADADG